jgi:hypothetical protein
MWQCPKCKREFSKNNQQHSCVKFPLGKHFAGKEKIAKPLFDDYVNKIKKNIGPVKIESLPCCIHLVSSYTFGAVWAMKDKIRIDFRLDKDIKDKKISRKIKISPNRYMYYFDIKEKKEIDKKLIGWVKKAYGLHEK